MSVTEFIHNAQRVGGAVNPAMWMRSSTSKLRRVVSDKWTLTYYEMVCLTSIIKPYCLYHT